MISNREIRRIFTLYGKLLQLHEKAPTLAIILPNAAFYVRRIRKEIMSLDKSSIRKLFRPPIAKIILELQQTGTVEALDELIQLTPSGLFEMMRIRGLGGKKLSVLWNVAKIDSIDSLLDACKKNELSKIPGFGIKTQQNIISAIESYRSSQDRFHLA